MGEGMGEEWRWSKGEEEEDEKGWRRWRGYDEGGYEEGEWHNVGEMVIVSSMHEK